MYRGIQGITDCQQLQTDINNMVTWSKNWYLMFNPKKCKVMSLGRSHIPANNTMLQCDGNILKIESSNLVKDLGIMTDSGLKFAEPMHMVSNKANGIIEVIRRTFTCLDLKCLRKVTETEISGLTFWLRFASGF